MQHVHDQRVTENPLSETLRRVAALGNGDEEIQLSALQGVPDEPGWATAAGLARDTGFVGDVMVRLGREYGTDNRPFAGTALLRDYFWRMLTPAAAMLLTERRLPDLRAENVALRFGEEGSVADLAFAGPGFAALPDDPEAGHPHSTVLASEDELLGWMGGALARTHLPAMVPVLRGLRVRRGTRVLWRAASDVCAEAFMFVGRDLGREAEGCALAERLLSGPTPLAAPANYYTLKYPGGSERTRVRNTCCLYYKVGDGCCFTCPRKSDEERVRQLREENETLEVEKS